MEIIESGIVTPEWAGTVTCGTEWCEAVLSLSLTDLTIEKTTWWYRYWNYDRDFRAFFVCPECERRQEFHSANRAIGYKDLYWEYQNRKGVEA